MRTPVPCVERGCINFAMTDGARCETHRRKAFAGNYRKERLPEDWQARRRAVLARDGFTCVVPECDVTATDVDHVIAGDDHSMKNLQALCREHHRIKTAYEGQWAQGRALTKGPEWIPMHLRGGAPF